jgi:putative transposase
MKIFDQGLYHIYNRGNNKQPLFFSEQDYNLFIELSIKNLTPRCHILAWCLMPNHFHFLLEINETSLERIIWGGNQMPAITNGFQLLQSNYAKIINNRENRSGSLFQQKTKSKLLETIDYAVTAFWYIHQNPVKSGLVNNIQDWEYSSYKEYSGLRSGKLCNVDLGKSILDLSDIDFEPGIMSGYQEDILDDIF